MLNIKNFRFITCSSLEYKTDENLTNINISQLTAKISTDIKSYLNPQSEQLRDIIHYSFSASGKMIRPQMILLTAATINYHLSLGNLSNEKLIKSEMIHTASLMHDDLIDCSDVRRGMLSCHKNFGPENAILGGDYILLCASQMLAKIGNCEVVSVISELINDLIKGEIMQLTSCENINGKLSHYYKKTYRKTASLIANCCKAVILLTNSNCPSESAVDAAFEFGRNIGMTFQLVDDILDVTASAEQLGKPSCGADMKLGLATGPVLFASEKFPEIYDIISRKLSKEGDLEKVLDYINRSNGVEQTRAVARAYHDNALNILKSITDSPCRKMLENLSEEIFNRTK
uniref:Subunit 1 of solanesyl diphosphate synthase n=1 Tax=Schmidtea mediterranea TaxID=79327 RepID=A0A0U4ZC84_SCHMD|nr:subunit 1 of solanesyl diphosphate synthase [Schmidtea mediterranea]